jgi:glycosyltransferase involved in cell wall biosynthesis
MRIVFISSMTQAPWGGSEELWSQAAVRLAEAGHHVAALTEKWTPLSDKVTAMAQRGVRLRLRETSRGALGKALLRRVTGWNPKNPDYAWVVEQKPDLVVISQGSISDGVTPMLFCLDAKLPYLTIAHCNAEIAWPEDGLAAALARAYLGAAQVCGVSQNNLSMLECQIGEMLPAARVLWNPNNVANAGLLPWPEKEEPARLACVGRLDAIVKGQDILFKVLARPEWRARPVELNLYGSGPNEHTLRRMVENLRLSNVHFRGYVNGIAEIWRDNHLLVMSSRQEGVPMTVTEAMWCGRPTLATDLGRCAELCADGETGFIASAAAVGPLAEALERAWARRAEWRAMGLAGRKRIVELVPRDPVGDFCELVKEVAARGTKAG